MTPAEAYYRELGELDLLKGIRIEAETETHFILTLVKREPKYPAFPDPWFVADRLLLSFWLSALAAWLWCYLR